MEQILKKIGFWALIIIFLECTFTILISHNINPQLIINIFLTSMTLSLICTFITSLFPEIINKIVSGLLLSGIGLLYSTQAVFYRIFKVYFSLYDLKLQDQLSSFKSEAIKLIAKNYFYLMWFLLPFILYLIIKKDTLAKKIPLKKCLLLLIASICAIASYHVFIDSNKNKTYSTYDLMHNVSNTSLSIKKIGVLNTYYIEGKRMIFGFTPKHLNIMPQAKEEQEEDPEIVYDDNSLELKLENTGNQAIDTINAYIKAETPTKKNEYTGLFEGYNLIYITAESFSEVGVREDLTPTLYKMIHSGFVFKNYYTPNTLSTIGGEFQSLTGLYPDYSILSKWRSGTNYFPFALANEYKKKGYTTYAYHNNSYVFQDRNQYIASQGFTNFLACYNGLEQRMNCEVWPESDLEMMEVTKGDYIHNDSFLAYYMTVSGHFAYTFDDNMMAYKNRELVENLPYKESAKAYIATQIELDRALENLINSLEAENKLDNTVFVLLADHYPYELDREAINQLSGYKRNDIEVNHNALIIWNNQLEQKIIDKPCMSSDVLPTVYNLFGIDYDSRVFTGKDILSTSLGIVVLEDRSWITEKGTYNATQNMFYPKDNNQVDEDYINNINQIVNSRLNLSRLIIENDYYRYIVQ